MASILNAVTMSPTTESFENNVEVTLTCDEGTGIYYRTGGDAPILDMIGELSLYVEFMAWYLDTYIPLVEGLEDAGSVDYDLGVLWYPNETALSAVVQAAGLYGVINDWHNVYSGLTEGHTRFGAAIQYTGDPGSHYIVLLVAPKFGYTDQVSAGNTTLYTEPFTLVAGTTVKAIATKSGYANSPIATEVYSFKCATPTYSKTPGVYEGAQTTTISTTTVGATIYYTTDESEPTIGSTLYEGSVTISESMTIRSIAVKANYTNSDIADAVYVIINEEEPPVEEGNVYEGGCALGLALNTVVGVGSPGTLAFKEDSPIVVDFAEANSFEIEGGRPPFYWSLSDSDSDWQYEGTMRRINNLDTSNSNLDFGDKIYLYVRDTVNNLAQLEVTLTAV